MAGLKEITAMCKAGQVKEAYELAKTDLEQGKPWGGLVTGWALYYLIKEDVGKGSYDQLVAHVDELKSLNQLTEADLNKILDNVIFWVGYFAKKYLPETAISTPSRLSKLYSQIKDYHFNPGSGYSALLEGFIRCETWAELLDFIEWWDLDNLTTEDYNPVKMNNGRSIMSVAERAFIAKSKALLRLNDLGKIESFIPQMDDLMNNHPEMTYPGYFYGKMLLALGSTQEEAIKVIIPFARKKASEFWVWQLISDVFSNTDDQDKQLACLLRAVNCRTQEKYIGKVRIKLAELYIRMNHYGLAKNQIDKVVKNYLSNGWRIPNQIDIWIHQPWFNANIPNEKENLDYMSITNAILCEGSEEAVAIVTYVDPKIQKVTMVYGFEKRVTQKLRLKVNFGTVLRLNYVIDSDMKIKILSSIKCKLPEDLNYARMADGTIKKKAECNYAFFQYGKNKAFVSPNLVSKYNLTGGEHVNAIVVYDFDKKKESWNWICANILNK